jgi:hypothetical protein
MMRRPVVKSAGLPPVSFLACLLASRPVRMSARLVVEQSFLGVVRKSFIARMVFY